MQRTELTHQCYLTNDVCWCWQSSASFWCWCWYIICWLVFDADNKWDEKEGGWCWQSAVQLRGRDHFAPLSFSNCSPQHFSCTVHCAAAAGSGGWVKRIAAKITQPVSLLQTECPHPRLQVEKMANIKQFVVKGQVQWSSAPFNSDFDKIFCKLSCWGIP